MKNSTPEEKEVNDMRRTAAGDLVALSEVIPAARGAQVAVDGVEVPAAGAPSRVSGRLATRRASRLPRM